MTAEPFGRATSPKPDLPFLLQELSNPAPGKRAAAISNLSDSIQDFLLSRRCEEERRNLSNDFQKRLINILRGDHKDPDEKVRIAAANALSSLMYYSCDHISSLRALVDVMQDESEILEARLEAYDGLFAYSTTLGFSPFHLCLELTQAQIDSFQRSSFQMQNLAINAGTWKYGGTTLKFDF